MEIIVSGNKANPALKRRVSWVIGRIAPKNFKNAYVEVNIVGDNYMKKNVLSYEFPKNFIHPYAKGKVLGEIFLNPDYIRKNGEDFDFMLIHGFLHLLGYDHKIKSDRIEMEGREKSLLRKIKK